MKMSITIQFEGYNTIIPDGFTQYYLKISDFEDIEIFLVDVHIQFTMKLWALFSKIGWEYYRWIDSFLDNIEDEISMDAFLKRVNWETALTTLQLLTNSQEKEKKVQTG